MEEAAEEAADSDADELEAEEDDAEKADKPKTKTESRTVSDWQVINSQKAIWTRSKEKVCATYGCPAVPRSSSQCQRLRRLCTCAMLQWSACDFCPDIFWD